MMLMARNRGIPAAIVPAENAVEAAIVDGVRVYPVASLPEAVTLAGDVDRPPPAPVPMAPAPAGTAPDMADIRGQAAARRGLEVAAAGTTCSSSARPAPARPCWPAACPGSCLP